MKEIDADMIKSIEMWLHEIEPKWVEKELNWLEELRSRLLESEIPNDLEEAVEKQIDEALFKWSYDDEDGIEQYVHDAFIAGYNLCKEQMMKEAVEGELYWDGDFLAIDLNMAALGYSERDKVRIIVLPKED